MLKEWFHTEIVVISSLDLHSQNEHFASGHAINSSIILKICISSISLPDRPVLKPLLNVYLSAIN